MVEGQKEDVDNQLSCYSAMYAPYAMLSCSDPIHLIHARLARHIKTHTRSLAILEIKNQKIKEKESKPKDTSVTEGKTKENIMNGFGRKEKESKNQKQAHAASLDRGIYRHPREKREREGVSGNTNQALNQSKVIEKTER